MERHSKRSVLSVERKMARSSSAASRPSALPRAARTGLGPRGSVSLGPVFDLSPGRLVCPLALFPGQSRPVLRPVPRVCLGLRLRLALPQVGVEPAQRQQLLVPALFDQAAAVEHQDLIGVHYRRQPVRDDQLRPALTRHGEVAHDLGLGRAVERRCGFIEDEDPRVLEIGPRDRQPLPLAARELQPRSPTTVWYFSGRVSTKPENAAIRAASRTSASVASWRA